MFLVQDTKGRKPKFHCLHNTRAVQELGKVWLDSTFVGGVYEELADSVESKNLAFQAVIERDVNENNRFQKRENEKIAFHALFPNKKGGLLASKMLDLNHSPVR